ncbi:DegT/DnrJ/EryC1/StrS family aminotransferase [Microbacterium yannicii]|uniref:DegT/DnrJ/EryC1/StrS family aminotransferase n=1 Tax=Microbacterium yannicii TaxID=671622 RepID=UPI0002EAC7ED|nr:DegT/DnrJ/EryC1/StrS family aminotransferase [Microbacterium yannicii]
MTTQHVPMLDLDYQHHEVAAEVMAGFERVLAAHSYIQGPEVNAFERAYADYLGAAHVCGVGNGTDALELALQALGIGPGDDVLLPANTFVATAEAVVRVGALPRLVDCDDDHLIDLAQIERAMTPATRAIIVVHLYGRAVDVAAVRAIAGDDVAIVEDAAQSQGARLRGRATGTLGDVAATSFYPGKNLGAYGDAGAVITDSDVIAGEVMALRNHGGTLRYQHDMIGRNSRLDGLQAVVLAAKLAHLDAWNEQRRAIADRYRAALAADERVVVPGPADPGAHVYHQFVVQIEDRERIFADMTAAGIGVGIHYPTPLHLLTAFAGAELGRAGDFPRAERQARRILSLPIYPGLTETMQDLVVDELHRTLESR